MTPTRILALLLAALLAAIAALLICASAAADGEPPRSVDEIGTPLDVTAHATRDSISVSWRSIAAATEWYVELEAQPQTVEGRWHPLIARREVANARFHTVRFDGLLPGHGHTLRIRRIWPYPPPGVAFDLRTEGAASDAELAARRPTISAARVDDGVLRVDWLPPAAAPDTEHVVTVREYGTTGGDLEQFTDAGVAGATFAEIKPGTTYRVLVETQDGYSRRDERIIETPFDLPQGRIWRDWFSPRLRVDWDSWTRPHGYGGFRITWDGIDNVEFAQVRWERDGYVMSSVGDAPIVINVDQPGRYAFRARFYLRGYKAWSNWTGLVHATTKPSQPYEIRVDERIDALRVEWDLKSKWDPEPSFTPVDGYRIRYERGGEPDRMFVVREGTSVTIPVENKCAPHRISVAAFSDEFGEGQAKRNSGRATRACLSMSVEIDALDATCNSDRNAPSVARWAISGGVGPYVIAVRGRKPVASDERRGLLRLFCEVQPTDGAHQIPVVVTDALGRRAIADIELPAAPMGEHDNDQRPRSAEISELCSISVHRNEVRLSWHCPPWEYYNYGWEEVLPSPTFLLRWRSAVSPEWTYINGTATPLVVKIINGCHWT